MVKHPSRQPPIAGCQKMHQKMKSLKEVEDRSQTLIPLHFLCGFPRRHRSMRIVKRKNITTPKIAGQTTKSCGSQPHFPSRLHAHQKKKRRQQDDETSDPEVVHKSPGRVRPKRRVNCDNGITAQPGKLDTTIFERYLENLWMSFSDERRDSFTYLDCLWFSLYTKESHKTKVLNWIKKKGIFAKKYVFVPIVRWSHWSLLIFCHFGESLPSKSRTPCMLLLDSLHMANPERLIPEIRKFVLDIYEAEERPEIKEQISRIPLKVPKVPQQRNGEECGNFVLYYINLFLESAPDNFSITEGYPYFMKKNWFTPEGLECFCKRLDSFCQ